MRATLLAMVAMAGLSSAAYAATEHYAAKITADEVPPKPTGGSGTVDATLDTATHILTYTVTYQGLSGPATMGHFHGPASLGTNAGVEIPYSGSLASPIKGTATLTPALEKQLADGLLYFNVHTDANKAGEIRGQVLAAK